MAPVRDRPQISLEMGGIDGPGQIRPVVRRHPSTGARSLDDLAWGLLPHGIDNPDTAPRPLYARADTVATNVYFADAFRRRRAIVPVDTYSQRPTEPDAARVIVSRADGKPMACACLWESYVWPNGDIMRTYCLITVETNELLAPIHDRMPVVLEEADWPVWLGEVEGDPAALLVPAAEGVLQLRPMRS